MAMNPFLGIFLHFIGGVAAGSFYVPFAKIKRWSWESYWLIFNLLAYVVMPWVVALAMVPETLTVLANSDPRAILMLYGLGVIWGIGGLVFGLSLRYLGMGLGMSVSLGVCAAVGTLIPPLCEGKAEKLLTTASGLTVLLGVAVCLAGIAVCGYAGIRKQREVDEKDKTDGVKEFALLKGFVVAVIAGVTSAAMSFGIDIYGKPVGAVAVALRVADVYQNIPVLIPLMVGNFTSNLVLCLILNVKNRSLGDYVAGSPGRLAANYFFAALAGVIGYQEFFWYGMGTTKLGEYQFSSWSIHLAFVIIISNLWGIFLKEWKGIQRTTWRFVWVGIALLILCTIIIGAGNYLAEYNKVPAPPSLAAE